MLCNITAKNIIVFFFKVELLPSGSSLYLCKCGKKLSNPSKNNIPKAKPNAAGNTLHFPIFSLIFMLGIISDQIDAAIITPLAKPINNFSTLGLSLFFVNNTILLPIIVPSKGANKAINILAIIISPALNIPYFEFHGVIFLCIIFSFFTS